MLDAIERPLNILEFLTTTYLVPRYRQNQDCLVKYLILTFQEGKSLTSANYSLRLPSRELNARLRL